MFLFKTFCCVSQNKPQASSLKTVSIKRTPLNDSNLDRNKISSSQLSVTILQVDDKCLKSNIEQKQIMISKQTDCMQQQKSTKSFNDTDQHSLQFHQTDKQNFPDSLNTPYSWQSDNYEIQLDNIKLVRNNSLLVDHYQNNQVQTINKRFMQLNFIQSQIKLWSVKQVLLCLEKIDLSKYTKCFYDNKIKGKDLVTLKESQLIEDLLMDYRDAQILLMYIKLFKEKSEGCIISKSIYRTFNGHRKASSFYNLHLSTYSCRKILNQVKNPIVEEQSEQDNTQETGRNQVDSIKIRDFYSGANISPLYSN